MGNCSLKGVTGNIGDRIRIMSDCGKIMEFQGPIQVRNIIDDFPGYGVFRRGRISSPMFPCELLFNGQLYYLLPLDKERVIAKEFNPKWANQVSPLRMSSRMESDLKMKLPTEPALEALPSLGDGIWRVKLVIDTKHLEEILSEQVNTEALIEEMRTIASSASVGQRRTKASFGVGWRPTISSVFKVIPGDH